MDDVFSRNGKLRGAEDSRRSAMPAVRRLCWQEGVHPEGVEASRGKGALRADTWQAQHLHHVPRARARSPHEPGAGPLANRVSNAGPMGRVTISSL